MGDIRISEIFQGRAIDRMILAGVDLASAWEAFQLSRFDGVVIEISWNGPEAGLDLIRQCRQADSRLPLFALSERHELAACFEAGADDFLREPFCLEEFRLRLEAMLARKARWAADQKPSSAGFSFIGVEVGSDLVLKFPDGAREEIRAKESDMLRLFAARAGRLVTKEELANSVWGFEAARHGNSVNQYLSSLRRTFRRHGIDLNRWITCVPKVGWRIEAGPVLEAIARVA